MIWHFEINLQTFIFENAENFKETINRSVICTLFWFILKMKTVHIQNADVTFVIFSVYAKYKNVFSEIEMKHLSTHKKHDHVIDTNNENSSYKFLYNLSNKKLQVLQSYLNDILVKSWIQYFVNSVETLVLFVLKKDSSLQLCVDYYELNKIIVKNYHSLFLISEILNQLSDIKIFIKLNFKNIYHCICIKMNNKWKMMFCIHYNYFKYLIMSFKFINTSATFQIYINRTLAKLINFICVVYLNDIFIYSQSEKEYKHYVCKILEWLQHYKLYTNLKKCVFSINTVKFLEFIVLIIDVMMNL